MIKKLFLNQMIFLINCLKIFDEVLKNIKSNKKKNVELANSGYITATDLADYLLKIIQCHLEKLIKKQLK